MSFISGTIFCVILALSTCFADIGYPGNVGVLSGASSSSRNGNTNYGTLSRSNVGTYSSGNIDPYNNNGMPFPSPDDTDDDTDDTPTNTNNPGVFSSAASMSSSGNPGGFYSSGNRINQQQNTGNTNFQFVPLDSNLSQDINAQIQNTIQSIFRKFGIQMQGSFNNNQQPTQYYQSPASGGALQRIMIPGSNNFGQTQVSFSATQPVVVQYKLIGTPGQANSGLAISVTSGDQGSMGAASSSASASNLNSGRNTGSVYAGVGGSQVTGSFDGSNHDDQDTDDSPLPAVQRVVRPGYVAATTTTTAATPLGRAMNGYSAQRR